MNGVSGLRRGSEAAADRAVSERSGRRGRRRHRGHHRWRDHSLLRLDPIDAHQRQHSRVAERPAGARGKQQLLRGKGCSHWKLMLIRVRTNYLDKNLARFL